jgi:RNA recognition motif-containing protein
MTRQLYVGNLSFDTTEATLRATFEQDGRSVQKVRIVTGRRGGRSRGFGFVEMQDEEQAQAAMAAHDGTEIDGREIQVREGKERAEARPMGFGRSSFSGGRRPGGRNSRF